MPEDYFPLGIAKGRAFCNRIQERKQLISNIEKNKHTIVISPRRYGKSSLVLASLAEMDLPYERVDLFVAVNVKTVEEQILKGVKSLLTKISSVPEQAVGFIKNYIKSLKSKWIVGTDGVHIELIPEKGSDSASVIMESLQMLENVLRKKNKQAVFFIDEFQEIGVLTHAAGIEGAIRHVAQESKNLRFIFSGSNRHILTNMFDDRSSPLYMLCDRITIDRIHEQDYIAYLNKIAKKTWKKHLTSTLIEEIFKLTERHPYYMNVLCDKAWTNAGEKLPTIETINSVWEQYILQEASKVAKDLSMLNISQKKILIAISQGISKDLTGKDILQKFNLTSAAIIKSLKLLAEQDYIGRYQNGEYFMIDPLIKASLIKFYPLMF
ncbi:MAG: ATP-binding protein [Gammaproteobacteria bacterium]|nr:ATP-binding protein [Gammaproteobacteria bacterium]